MNIMEMQWELAIAKNLNINLNNPVGFDYSLFVYIDCSCWLLLTLKIHSSSDVHDCKHDDGSVEFLEL